MWRDARGSYAHTKPNFTTTSSSSALRNADCYFQFPEDRSSWRRHGFSTQIQQKFEKKIQTLSLRSSVIGAKDPEKPTKCDGDSVVLSF